MLLPFYIAKTFNVYENLLSVVIKKILTEFKEDSLGTHDRDFTILHCFGTFRRLILL